MFRFSAWLPDLQAIMTAAAQEAKNVIPTPDGYRPFSGFAAVASAVTARAQGAASFRDSAGNIHNFCGDATKLYKMASDGLSWSDVSRTSGGAYACPAAGWWVFFQYGDLVFALNGVDAVQTYTLGSSTNFAAGSGSPPIGAFGGTVLEFAVIARVAGSYPEVAWSAIGSATDWVSSSATLSDSQIIPDGGTIMGFRGGEFGVVFQERALTRMSFEGPPTAFRFDKISNQLGCRAERSIASYDNLDFWLSDDGVYMMRGGIELVPIGEGKVDRWIEENLDAGNLDRVSAAIDPVNKLYVMGFPDQGAGGVPNSLLIYHWPTGKFSRAVATHEIIYPAATQSGYTLEDLDDFGDLDSLLHSLDSRFWTGSGRLLLSGFNSSHQSGFFTGASLEATIETGDTQIYPGHKAMIRRARPLVEGTSVTPQMKVGYRNNLHDAVTYSDPVSINANGVCPFRINSRYHRGQVIIPASSTWDHAVGIDDVVAVQMGARG